MALSEQELPPLETEDDALERIETVIQAVADGRLSVKKAMTSVRATAIWYYLHRQDQERTRLTRAVRRAATELRGELADARDEDDEPWKRGGLEGDGRS